MSADSGSQVGSAVVFGFPSVSARRIALSGRHRSIGVWYFASQAAMPASAMEIATSAKSRAFWNSVSCRWRATIWVCAKC